MEEMQIVSKGGWKPEVGEAFMEFVESQKKLNKEEKKNLREETTRILSKCVNAESGDKQTQLTILVVGYVQSGKTLSFTALSALAHDNGYRLIIYLAGTKNNLLRQTTQRLNKDLITGLENGQNYFKHKENPKPTDAKEIKNKLGLSQKPTYLITVLKHSKHINDLSELFAESELADAIGNNGAIIIDDEADQASLNGYANKNSKAQTWEECEYSATYSSILKLTSQFKRYSYIQYTATPQAPLLISLMDTLSPKSHIVLTPGEAYRGGRTFFREEPGLVITIPKEEVYSKKKNDMEECPKSLETAMMLHMMQVAIEVKIKKEMKYLTMMVHADKEQDASEKFGKWIENTLAGWVETIDNGEDDMGCVRLKEDFSSLYGEAIRMYAKHGESYPSFDEVWSQIPDTVKDTSTKLIISRSNDKTIDWERGDCSYIVVGADMLNRGFTIENLATTYMPRNSITKPNADTIQQRCRFFGYKEKYLWACRVFLPEESILEYCDYVEHEEEMREWLKRTERLEDGRRQLMSSDKFNPTRKSVLPKDIVKTNLVGWKQTNAFGHHIEDNKEVVTGLIDRHKGEWENFGGRDNTHIFVEPKEAIDFIEDFQFNLPADVKRADATARYLRYCAEKKTLNKVHIVMMSGGDARGRRFDPMTQTINQLFSGEERENKAGSQYRGDKAVKVDDGDSITIQIHNVKLKCDSVLWGGKEAYTLAIYYPEALAKSYIGD